MTQTEEQKEQAILKFDHSKFTDYPAITGEKFSVIRKTICKDFTPHEIYYFLNVAHSVGLNPFMKEVWTWKDKSGKIVTTTGIAGYRTNASRHKDYKGMDSAVVYEGDTFNVDFVSKKIEHQSAGIPDSTKKIIGAWARCNREGFEPTISVVRMSEYKKSGSAWENNPSKMILKVAEGEALSKQFPINGIVPEWETVTRNGETDYVNHSKGEESEDELKNEELKDKILEALEVCELYEGEDKERIVGEIKLYISDKRITVELLDDYIAHMQNNSK